MKYWRIKKDKLNRLFFRQLELKWIIYICFKHHFYLKLPLIDKEFNLTRRSKLLIKNFCIISGRPRGILRDFKLSRISLRKLGAKGYLFGLKKKSW